MYIILYRNNIHIIRGIIIHFFIHHDYNNFFVAQIKSWYLYNKGIQKVLFLRINYTKNIFIFCCFRKYINRNQSKRRRYI